MRNKIPVLLFLFFLFLTSSTLRAGQPWQSSSFKEGDCVPGTIILKVKPAFRSVCLAGSISDSKLQVVFSKLNVTEVSKMFPHATPAEGKNKSGEQLVDLSLLYKIQYASPVALERAMNLVQSTGIVDYAVPEYIQHTCFIPNDPMAGSQYHLAKINAYNAWNVCQGDTNIVIGIVDSGTDWDHPDLVNSIKYNYADVIDGLDNDSDGFVDNFRGWDVSDNDNDPMIGNDNHGSHVSGCAAATTNNGTGVAAPAFKCKFLPVKAAVNTSTNTIDHGYEGIVYAADHGCSVVNCSWGRSGGFDQFEQDIINYAAINHDVVVVCAAGNSGVEQDYYPASYDHAVSVAATEGNDAKAGFSNYGYHVDVCAPGDTILATVFNDTYTRMSGTSMASPIAAGCVALVRSRFPSFNADQAAEQLRVTCDNINAVPGNVTYTNKLGGGRVNLFNAMNDTLSPGIRVSNLHVTDGYDDVFLINDTLRISAMFTNLLRPSSNLVITLTAQSANVTVLSNTFNIGVLNTMDSISNNSVPFRVRIRPSAPLNATIPFKMTITDGTFTDYFSFGIVVNVDYLNIAVNNVATTITSIGRIGYNSAGPGQGLGFTYLGSASLLYEAGLMTGIDTNHVSDNVRNTGSGADNDYKSRQTVQHIVPGISDFDAYGKFDDTTSAAPMSLLIQHRAYAWNTVADRNYVMVHYTIRNNGVAALNNFYAGIFTDWDVLPDNNHNRVATDASRKLGYTFSTDSGGYYAGVKLLTFGGFNHYGIDNDATGQGGINMSDGYSTKEKYFSLSTMRTDAGVPGPGNEVCDVTSTGPYTILPGDSVIVAFAILAANDLPTLQAAADAAQIKYDGLIGVQEISRPDEFFLHQNYPNPVHNFTTFDFALTESNFTEMIIFNTAGQKVKSVMHEKLNAGSYRFVVDLSSLENGNYFCRLVSGKNAATIPVLISH